MKSKTITIKALLKIGDKVHIEDLQKNGTIYCNSIRTFRQIESRDRNRCDKREGAYKTEILNPEWLTVSVDGKQFPFEFISARLNLFDKEIENHKLYCLFGFKKDCAYGVPFINKKNCAFGDKALLITDSYKFISRIESRLKEQILNYRFDWVNYYKEASINDGLSVFDKPVDFEYQSEFRFYIQHEDPEPLVISIGSIEDISIVLDSSELADLILKPL